MPDEMVFGADYSSDNRYSDKIGEAHQENFTSLQQKCMEKMALFVNSNVVIYDEDNDLINRCADMMLLSQKAFSWSRKRSEAPLYISKIDIQDKKTAIHYSFLRFEHSVDIPFADEASIENAIHCLAVLLFLGIHPREISKRMMTLEPVAMRLDVRQGKTIASLSMMPTIRISIRLKLRSIFRINARWIVP